MALQGVENSAPEASAAQTVVFTGPSLVFPGRSAGQVRQEMHWKLVAVILAIVLCARRCSQHHASLKALDAQESPLPQGSHYHLIQKWQLENGEGGETDPGNQPVSGGAGICTPEV